MVNWLTRLLVVVSRRIDGMTVSMMAIKVFHCSPEKGNSEGPSGSGVARGARASTSVVAMLDVGSRGDEAGNRRRWKIRFKRKAKKMAPLTSQDLMLL
jgi:hypothetical protein